MTPTSSGPQVIIDGKYDYSDPAVQRQVLDLLERFENSTFVASSLYTEAWLRDWVNLLETSGDFLQLDTSTPEKWTQSLKQVRWARRCGL